MTARMNTMDQLTERALEYLGQRGFSAETAVRAGLTSTPDGSGIVWPYVEFDEVVNGKVWRPPAAQGERPQWRFAEAGRPLSLWNADVLLDDAVNRKDQPMAVVITEGEWDALSAIEAGYPFAVSMPNGAPAPIEHGSDVGSDHQDDTSGRYQLLHRRWADIKLVQRWIIATDNDGPGRQLAQDLVRRFGTSRCSFIQYPNSCKDLNEVLVKTGPAAVAALISAAKPYPVKGLFTLADLPNEPPRVCVSTGWPNLDEGWKPYQGQFTVITGIPGVGKTTWLSALVGQLAEQHGWVTCLGALENSPHDYVEALTRFRIRKNPKFATDEEIAAARA